MGKPKSKLDSDEKNGGALCIDPLKFLQSLSILSGVKSATEAVTLLLSSISVKYTKLPQETPASTRKRSSDATSKDKDSETKKARKNAKKARENKDKENKRDNKTKEDDWKCYICDITFSNLANLKRHINESKIHLTKTAEKNKGKQKFSCTLCYSTLCSVGNLNRHLRLTHSIEPNSQGTSKFQDEEKARQTKPKPDSQNSTSIDVDSYIFVCTECDVSKLTIDCAVEHAQLHQFPAYAPMIPQTCEICQLTFEEHNFAEHSSIHNNPNRLILNYTPFELLNNAWSDIFEGINDTVINKIKSSSVYEHTRKVKMNTDDSDDPTGKPIYQCNMCQMHVSPEEIEDHCNKECACNQTESVNYLCGDCRRLFYTAKALTEHEKEDNGNVVFRTIIFNCIRDRPVNRVLRNLQNTSQPPGATSRKEFSTRSTDALENRSQNVQQFCQECGKFIPTSDIKAHEAAHYNYAGVEDECAESAAEQGSPEQNYSTNDNEEGNIADRNLGEDETLDENNLDQENGPRSSTMLEGSNMEGEAEKTIDKSTSQLVELVGDSFNAYESYLRQKLRESTDKDASKSGTANDVIEISDDSDCEDDESNRQPPTQGTSKLYEPRENDESLDDKSIIKLINVDENNIKECEANSGTVSNEMLPINLNNDENADENDEERRNIELQLLIEEERRIKAIMSGRD